MSNTRKKNFMTKRKKNYSKEFQTMFNIGISSKALFGLSPGPLKLYMMFVLNGRKSEPSISRFSKMSGFSPRTISRYYEELKEKGFLKITPIGVKRYKYEFDPYGNVNKVFKKKEEKPIEEEVKEILVEKDKVETPAIEKEPVVEINEFVERSKDIEEYEDFAILENHYWNLDRDLQKEIVSILEKRYEIELHNRDALEWFLNKVR